MNCIAEPLSRNDIRQMTKFIRKIANQEKELFFDIVRFLDVKLPKIDPDFSLIIEDKAVLGECHGLTYPDRNEIHIRNDVYYRALEGSGRDRLTMAHELFHLLQHTKENISYARIGGKKVEAFRSPEWQANAFGGELLVPYDLTREMSIDEIVEKCGVSYDAATKQYNVMHMSRENLFTYKKPSAQGTWSFTKGVSTI